MHTEEEIRRKVKKLQQFYMNLLVFVGANVLFSLIWLTSNRGTPFWPKYIIVIWGVLLIFKAYRMKIFSEYIPFLTPEWEKMKMKELLEKEESKPVEKKVVPIQKKAAPVKKKAAPVKKKVSPSKPKKKTTPNQKKKS